MTLEITNLEGLLTYFQDKEPETVGRDLVNRAVTFNLVFPDIAADVFVLLKEEYHAIVWPYLKKELIANITNFSDLMNILLSLEVGVATILINELDLVFINTDEKKDSKKELILSDIYILYWQLKVQPEGKKIFDCLMTHINQTLLIAVCVRMQQVELYNSAKHHVAFYTERDPGKDFPSYVKEKLERENESAHLFEYLEKHPTYFASVGVEYILAILSYLEEEFNHSKSFYQVTKALMPLLSTLELDVFIQCLKILPQNKQLILLQSLGPDIKKLVKTHEDHMLILSELYKVVTTLSSDILGSYCHYMGEHLSSVMTNTKALIDTLNILPTHQDHTFIFECIARELNIFIQNEFNFRNALFDLSAYYGFYEKINLELLSESDARQIIATCALLPKERHNAIVGTEVTNFLSYHQEKNIGHFGRLMLSGRFANSDSQADIKVDDPVQPLSKELRAPTF